MKVLHVTSGGDTGGGKSHILGLLSALQGKIDAHILCFLPGPVYQGAMERGIPARLLPQERRYDLSVLKELRRVIGAGGYDLIHSHGSRSNFLLALLKRRLHVPLVTTIHSDYELDFLGNIYKQLVYKNLNKLALRSFDYYIAVSGNFRDMLISRGFPAGRLFTVYNGLDLSQVGRPTLGRDAFLKEMGVELNSRSLLVGTMGRLHPVKGQGVLLKAIPRVLADFPQTHFLIAGDGSEHKNLVQQAQRLGVGAQVHFAGYVQEAGNYFNAVDINVLPSKSESFPYVLLEGALYRLPTVASAVGGIPELIVDGENGFLVAPGDSGELAQRLLCLLGDGELRRRLGENFFAHVRDNFSTVKLAADHVSIYEEILAEVTKGR
ncbi:MAG: glycosyltransferase family 4 protein [Firmicutes bacterium]|nr:glycosyltransferase family 4 protein [Bacillota bacterium]